MIVGVPRESYPNEQRVALIPASVPGLLKAGLDVVIEIGAGTSAGFADALYEDKGATVVAKRREVFERAGAILQVRTLGANPEKGRADLELLRPGQAVLGLADPLIAHGPVRELAALGVSLLALEMMPRITKAQSMDVLSSMATVAGYKAVLLAAASHSRMFPMLMTAAGTITPAHVLVVGAGVAGLQAIATARRLGAVVAAYDVRPAVKEQVESLGGRFIELELETGGSEDEGGYARELGEDLYRRQRQMMQRIVASSDVVITTAAVPGKKAPVLVTAEMVESMQPGSMILDLAAERGGNCELTRPGETVRHHGVTIMGPDDLPSSVPYHASQMYSKNISTFLLHLVRDGELHLASEDEITSGTLITHQGEVVHPAAREALGLAPIGDQAGEAAATGPVETTGPIEADAPTRSS